MGKEFQRMRYFDGLFLNAEDYTLDQEYFLRLQRLHNRYLHTWGIVCGLQVLPLLAEGEPTKVLVTEGLALNQVSVTDPKTDKKESLSQEILIYDGHPDNPVDLSEYAANESIYIYVSYQEVTADRNIERGQGKEIHTWERGVIAHSTTKPTDPSAVILARVLPRKNDDAQTVIDSSCILDFDSDADRTPLRVYAGATGKKMVVEKLVVSAKTPDVMDGSTQDDETLAKMPTVTTQQDGGILEVKAKQTNFTGDVEIAGDLTLVGELIIKGQDSSQSELKVTTAFVQVNSPDVDDGVEHFPGPKDGGFEVYRGNGGTQDARIVWVENEQVFKAGIGNDLKKIAYGNEWDSLVKNEIVDNLHKHSKLTSRSGAVLGFTDKDVLFSGSDLAIKDDKTILLKAAAADNIDSSHGLGWFGKDRPFAAAEVDGPVLFGQSGGMLGSRALIGGAIVEKPALSWNGGGNVGIGPRKTIEDNLDVDGSLKILSGKNPIRFTSEWSGFPDNRINGAEISNDTNSLKALVIVGNQSAGQDRKVAIWDRLDVNGFLYVNGRMQASKEIIPSAGSGNNGIIFPANPGGGGGDLAWIKYYPRQGEECTLEIGTSNDGNDHISLNASGNVGIGTLLPNDKLEVAGGMRLMTGPNQNPLRITSGWTNFAGPNQAEISNDTTNYKTLMIVGNSSGGQGRKVSVWDRLDVNGFLQVNGSAQISGNLQINGTIITDVLKFDGQINKLDVANNFQGIVRCADFLIGYPGRRGTPGRALVDAGSNLVLNYGNDWSYASVHSSLQVSGAVVPSAGSGNNGIIFPSDPGGGWGDSAWIKFYPTGGENCVLDIGVSNDSGDRINLHASGGVYANGSLYWWSSRELKENIADIPVKEAKQLLESLNPVSFKYKGGNKERTLGFIAEEVPSQLADPEQRAVSGMDIIAVLTSVLKDQQKAMTRMQKQIAALQGA